jgi:hypothetical protein
MEKLFILCILLFLFLKISLCQGISTLNDSKEKIKKEKKNFYEIHYHFAVFPGFSYMHKFNKVIVGAGFQRGFGWLLGSGGGLTEGLKIFLKTRNVFSKRKTGNWIDYDIGFFYSKIILEDDADFYGFNTTLLFVPINFIKIGIDARIGRYIWDRGVFMDYGLSPELIISF